MKRLLVLILAGICVGILISGAIHWNNKTAIQLEEASASEGNDKEERDFSKEQRIDTLLSFAANWPEEAALQLEETLVNEEPYKIVFVGSDSLGEGAASWPGLVEEQLTDTYGEDVFDFASLSYDLTSTEFVDEGRAEDIIEEQPDLVLFEPFTLNDNGVVVIETSLDNTESVMDAVRAANEDVDFILQPPHPLYSASWYKTQVESLEGFATDSNIPYFNHWEAWPETDDPVVNDYLVEDHGAPNEEGHQLWAQFLLDYFIAD